MSQNAGGFAAFVPGFEFLQTLAQQGQQLGAAASGLPQLNHWVAPTFDVEELDKRIQELKAVHFWLEQNSKALAATIQALEVQKMTLATLKTMNVNLGEMAQAMQVDPQTFATPKRKHQFAGFEVPPQPAARAPEPAPQAESIPDATTDKTEATESASPKVDPLQWWGALSQQFQSIASQALQEVVVPGMAAAEQVAKAATAPLKTSAAKTSARAPATAKRAAAKKGAATGARTSRAQPAAKKTAPRAATNRRQK